MSHPTPSVPPAKKSKTLLFVALGLVLLLGGGGAAAYFVLAPGDRAATEEKARAKRVEPIYVALDPPFVVNFESSSLVRFLQVTVHATATEPATVDLIKRHDPVIRNGLLMLFSNQSYDTLRTAEGKEALRQGALEEIRRIVGEEGGRADDVRNLYFTSFVMQ